MTSESVELTVPQRQPFTVMGAGGVRLVGERWPAPNRSGTVLLLHGGGQTRHSWSRTSQRLAQAGWDAIAMDTRGHGDSDWGTGPDDYEMDSLVADLVSIVMAVGEKPVVIGASMGGMTALVGEGEIGGLLRGLVLVDVVPSIELAGIEKITAFMRSGMDGFESLHDVADAIAAYNPHRKRPANLDGLRKNVRLGDDGRWHWHWDPTFIAHNSREPDRGVMERAAVAARAIRVPTLLIRGAESDVVTAEGARELLSLIPRSQMVDVADAGHMVAGDDNDVFSAAVEGFLRDLSGAPNARERNPRI
jgi:pimeloyl-ACP methyl ester carboxylesterase